MYLNCRKKFFLRKKVFVRDSLVFILVYVTFSFCSFLGKQLITSNEMNNNGKFMLFSVTWSSVVCSLRVRPTLRPGDCYAWERSVKGYVYVYSQVNWLRAFDIFQFQHYIYIIHKICCKEITFTSSLTSMFSIVIPRDDVAFIVLLIVKSEPHSGHQHKIRE